MTVLRARLVGHAALATVVVCTAAACTPPEDPRPEPLSVHAGFDPASTVGTLAPGLPGLVTAPPPDAEVLASSVRPDGPVVAVSVNLRVPAPPESVDTYYDQLFTDGGFTASGATGSRTYVRTEGEGTTDRIDETVVLVTVVDENDTLVSLSGRLRPDEDALG